MHELKQALATCTESGRTGRTSLDQAEAVAEMQEKYDVCCGLFHGHGRSRWVDGTSAECFGLLLTAQVHIRAQENDNDRCFRTVRDLSQAFSFSVTHEEAIRIRDDVTFFQAASVLAGRAEGEVRPERELNHAVRQMVSRPVASKGVVDIFAAAGLKKPDISILSDEFFANAQGMPQRSLGVEQLRKLLKGKIAVHRRTNVVQARSFAEMLEQTLRNYQNRTVEVAQMIE